MPRWTFVDPAGREHLCSDVGPYRLPTYEETKALVTALALKYADGEVGRPARGSQP